MSDPTRASDAIRKALTGQPQAADAPRRAAVRPSSPPMSLKKIISDNWASKVKRMNDEYFAQPYDRTEHINCPSCNKELKVDIHGEDFGVVDSLLAQIHCNKCIEFMKIIRDLKEQVRSLDDLINRGASDCDTLRNIIEGTNDMGIRQEKEAKLRTLVTEMETAWDSILEIESMLDKANEKFAQYRQSQLQLIKDD